jgi:hypothetical protein
VGALLGALVAANAPALKYLDVSRCALGDEGLGPLVGALAVNTHLQVLFCGDAELSEAFAVHRLRPALLANTSLELLMPMGGTPLPPSWRGLRMLVNERAAARAAAASAAWQLAALAAMRP